MATEPQYVDLDDDSDLARLADEVRATNAPRLLHRGGVVIATITPATSVSLPKRKPLRAMTEEEREQEFRASFGGWKDVDTDQLLQDIYAQREMSMPQRKPLGAMTEAEREQEFRSSFGALRGHEGLNQARREIDARRGAPMPENFPADVTDHDTSR